jgi:hypothetical protein
MRPGLTVIQAPCFNDIPDLLEAAEPVLVQAFVAKPAVEALHVAIVDRFARADELQLDPASISPGIQGIADELRAVIDDDLFRQAVNNRYPSQNLSYPLTADRRMGLDPKTFFRVGVDYREQSEFSSGVQRIVQKIHCSKLIGPLGLRKFDTCLRRAFFPPTDAYLKLFFAINALRSLFVLYQLLALQEIVQSTATKSLPEIG